MLKYALAINSTGYIFAGTYFGGIYRSADNGENWTQINVGLTNTDIRTLATNSSGHIFAGSSSGVFRSTDNGDNWTQINNGFTISYVLALAFNSSNDVFAGTYGYGVFRSRDNGENWEEWNNGLTEINVQALLPNPNEYIFAGTFEKGIYRSLNSTTSIEAEDFNHPRVSLSQNYPNPFNPTTNIKFRIPDFGFVSLKVYNILGRQITTLINEEISAGTYEVEFVGKNLPSGIYFYQLKTGNHIEIKKMMLLK